MTVVNSTLVRGIAAVTKLMHDHVGSQHRVVPVRAIFTEYMKLLNVIDMIL